LPRPIELRIGALRARNRTASAQLYSGTIAMLDNETAEDTLLTLTADIVAAHVSNNSVAVNDLPNLIQNVHGALSGISGASSASVKPDYIVCLEDGKKLKMLKRHLMTHYNMTPDQYRQKWGLTSDYPMVAPNYAEQRRTLAKSIGLGTKRKRTRK
jgi:predicted transcriptional regulator